MTKQNLIYWFLLPGTDFALLLLNGCNPSQSERSAAQSKIESEASAINTAAPGGSATTPPAAKDGESEHGHIPGSHGGVMISLGRDSYDLEAFIDSLGARGFIHWATTKVV
jgi:hypothetical protein